MDIPIYIVANFFRVYVMVRFAGLFFKDSLSYKKRALIYSLVFSLTNSILHIMFANPFINLAVNIVGMFIGTYLLEGKTSIRFLATFLTYLVCMTFDSITYNLFLKFIDTEYLFTIGNIMPCILVYVFFLIIQKLQLYKEKSLISTIHWASIFSIPIGSMIIIIIAFLAEFKPHYTLLIVSILLIINIIVFYLYEEITRHYIAINEKERLKSHNLAYAHQIEILNNSQEYIRRFKHDIKNHYFTINNLLELNRIDELKSYLKTLYEYTHPAFEYVNSGNSEIDAILNYKLHLMKCIGTQMHIGVKIPTKLSINLVDLNIILSNILDNAYEALQKTEERELFLDISYDRGVLYIDLSNTYKDEIILKEKRYVTTKMDKKSHGIGIMNVRETVNKYSGDVNINWNNTVFSIEILMYDR